MNAELINELVLSTVQNPSGLSLCLPSGSERILVESSKFLKDGQLITVRADTGTAGFPEHTHDYVEIVYMCRGQCTHIVNGETISLKEGEFLFLSQNSRQENLPSGEDDIAINFIVRPAFFKQILAMLGEKETLLHRFIIQCLIGTSGKATFLHFCVSDVFSVQNLVENLVWNLLHESSDANRINELTMSLLFIHLMNNVDDIGYNGSDSDSFIFKVLEYIEKNYTDGSLNDLAARIFYDANALSKQIKRLTGKTYTQLVQEKRLMKSCELLKNTTLGIEDVSLKVGYDNVSYFHRLFFRTYGISPKKYRDSERKHRKAPQMP